MPSLSFPTAGTYIPSSNSNAVDTTPLIQNQNEFTVRGDQNFGAKNSAWFRYSFINSRVTTSGWASWSCPQTTRINARDFGGSFVHIFSPSLILQAQFARVHRSRQWDYALRQKHLGYLQCGRLRGFIRKRFCRREWELPDSFPWHQRLCEWRRKHRRYSQSDRQQRIRGQRNQDHRQPRAKVRRQLDQQPLCQPSLTDLVGVRCAGYGESTSRNRGGYRRSIFFFPS